ncbi:CubicO group peptidase (beta-lactamase class C family) [Actinoplanes octamycinicus]|uniref:CubicO group peptidase (Beta-lactamase class C family) n=1 Tax=Actinoplanes octamycinicus TaxID=135948 RepID=A0A7W7H6E0_9ACTN|nr:serine hydrolase domain-containing protein [Actinoplanes octamycinicus]MBB4744860.1 CubicO group peptidase (beta-lactamase class C family) [Actinoplanes octamycinicus]GIE55446.1 serine hydrolase [Actinoplanes octamycinicus]
MAIDLTGVPERVGELLAEYRIPSAVLGVLRGGETATVAVGVTDVATGEPATTSTVYQVGSMTKTWTALAFLQSVDEGRASLDEPVRTWLPGFRVADPEVSARVTPRHLLQHTSGIEEDFGDPGEGDDVHERMVAGIAGARQVHPLGHTHGYSAALGYAILARILEVLDGKRWDDVLADRLLGPLGLTATTSRPADAGRGPIAKGHLPGPVRTPVDRLPRCYGPGGGISSTIGDVLTTARFLLDGPVHRMGRSRVPVPDPYLFGPAWALGLIVCDWHGETVYASDGSTIGQNARLRLLPEADLAIAMLTNGGPRESFYKRVFNEILTRLDRPTIPELPEPDPTLALDPADYVGVFARPGISYEVVATGDRLQVIQAVDPMQARILGRPDRVTYDLLPISRTHFLMPPATPLEDPQTVAVYDHSRYLHTNCRVHPRVA